ncbi:Crp/Fnr family transcriptional regulator [Aquipseudomonas campi]|uniref:Crp/Fnr family transcriptional regulator n=1 Tax=Aquipseudomonas campi TaxID=2731681 RepID=A0A6M8FYT6_9GAMM|nr:Crp/Fnr family transcriptional regulator [Pseudomonas campi]QKE65006.1 Crp/Fnr family transcriptional regulator [Pseudomonas campi]
MSSPDTLHQQLLAGHWFSHLPAALQQALLDQANERQLSGGQRLFRRGDPPCGLYAVLDGAIRVGAVNRDGKEALLTLVEPPYWFGEISLFDGQPRTHDAYAEGPTRLLQVPQGALLTLLEQQPHYWREFALLMSQKLRLAFIALEEMSLLPAAPRLARRLLLITEGYGETGPRRVIHLAQEQLALMLALSRQTTNQILKELEARGALRLNYGEIEILDLECLRQVAQID